MIHANDNGRPITFISMFSGIEAASVAFGPLGWKALCFAEIEKFPSAVLAHHYPDVPNVGDMSKHDWAQYRGKVDIVCGGPPCQDFSIAGLRAGLDGERGNLSIVYMRALHAIKPRNAIVENVPGWLNDKKNAFGCFLAGLVGADDPLRTPDGKSWPNAGMVAGPLGRAAWRVLDAQYFGLAQRRRRVLVVADFGNGADPAAVLFERKGLFGNTPPSREAGKDVAPTISARTKGGGGLGTDFDLDGGLRVDSAYAIQERAVSLNLDAGPQGKGYQPDIAYTLEARNKVQSVAYAPEIARCDATREGSSQDYETTTMVAVGVTGDIAHTLKAEGADASEDGTGRGTPIVSVVPIDMRQASRGATMTNNRKDGSSGGAPGTGIGEEGDPCPTISTSHPPAICFSAKDYGADASFDIAPTLRAGGHSGSHQNGEVMPAVAYAPDVSATIAARSSRGGGQTNSPGHNADQQVVVTSAVRRLPPVECERLQGFPDGYTDIPWRGKPNSPDGPRYKGLGNSWAVPKFVWLGKRIQQFMPASAAVANDNQEIPIANAAINDAA